MAAVTDRIYRLQVELAQESLRALKQLEKHAGDANKKIDVLTEGAKGLAKGLAAGFTVDAFISGITNAVGAVDDLSAASERLGVDIEVFSGLAYAAEQSDASIEQLEAGMRTLQKTIADTGSKGAKVLEALQVDTSGDTTQTLLNFGDALQQIQDPAQKTAALTAVLGKSGAALGPLLSQGAEGVAELTDEAERLGLVVDGSTADALGELDNQMLKLQASSKAAFVQIASGLAPSLIELSNQFIDSSGNASKFKAIGEGLGVVLRGLANGVAIVAKGFEVAGGNIGAVMAAIAAAGSGDFSGALDILKMRVSDVGTELAELGDTLTDLSTADVVAADTTTQVATATAEQAAAAARLAAILDSSTTPAIKDQTTATKKQKDALDEMLPGQKEWQQLTEDGIALHERMRTDWEVMQAQFEEYNRLLSHGRISQEDYNRAVRDSATDYQQAQDGAEKAGDSVAGLDGLTQSLMNSLPDYGKELSGMLVDFATNSDDASTSFEDFTINVLRNLAEMATQVLIITPLLENLMTTFGAAKSAKTAAAGAGGAGSLLSGAGDWISDLFGSFFAQGGVFAGGNPMPFANGGVVSRPTIFPFANGGVGLMGEAGSEAIMPLQRDSQGRLGVTAQGSGSSGVTVVINNNAPDTTVTASEQQQGPDGQQFVQITIEKAVDNAFAKGRFDPTLQAVYGISRKGRS